MAVKTLDDVLAEICDVAGIYGAHGEEENEQCGPELKQMCRVCAENYLRDEIIAALDVEARLGGRR